MEGNLMKHGTDWYKREPMAYLGGVQGMSAKEHAVYSIIIDLIYQHGGSVNDDPAWFAGWISDMGSAAVRKVIESLIGRGKLIREGNKITNKRAKFEAQTKENLRETRAKYGQKGGVQSGEYRSTASKNNILNEANGVPREEERREEQEREREREPTVSLSRSSSQSGKGSRLSKDWVLSKPLANWSLSQGLSQDQIKSEAEKFKDYWIGVAGAKGLKADWDATWRNWIRNATTNSPNSKFKTFDGDQHGRKPRAKSKTQMDAFIAGARGSD
jgi:uncharacterized protein YdaU (DUF1376 family)